MITVAILINGQPITARSAVNTGRKTATGETEYECDDGSILLHHRDRGAVALATLMLGTIRESGKKGMGT